MASAMCSPCLFFRTILTEFLFHVLSHSVTNYYILLLEASPFKYLTTFRGKRKVMLRASLRGSIQVTVIGWASRLNLLILRTRGVIVIFRGARSIVPRLLLCCPIDPASDWWLICVCPMFVDRVWGVSGIWLSWLRGLLIRRLVDIGVISLGTKPFVHCNLSFVRLSWRGRSWRDSHIILGGAGRRLNVGFIR